MESAVVEIHVVPGASADKIVGLHGGKLKIRVAARPVKGQSNARLIRILSRRLGVPKTNMEILSGSSSRGKRIRIKGISKDEFERRFSEFFG